MALVIYLTCDGCGERLPEPEVLAVEAGRKPCLQELVDEARHRRWQGVASDRDAFAGREWKGAWYCPTCQRARRWKEMETSVS